MGGPAAGERGRRAGLREGLKSSEAEKRGARGGLADETGIGRERGGRAAGWAPGEERREGRGASRMHRGGARRPAVLST